MGNKRLWGLVLLACGLCAWVIACGASPNTTVAIDAPVETGTVPSLTTDSPAPPTTPVKLIFIHHSCGENWLNDGNGGLGLALRDNNYFVSDTNYGWGPDSIGDHTDIPDWPAWFVGPDASTYTAALYTEYGQNSSYTRLVTDPGGENQIVMFKSCYPNSDLSGNPDDPPYSEPNAWELSVGNAKAVYNAILTYFAAHQEKLFIAITAPPLMNSATSPAAAANARAFNNWLINDWLDAYPHHNVAVFDFYNVLTSNGGDANTNDYDQRPTGNHHYWNGSEIAHTQTVDSNDLAYPTGDSHPSAAGNQKATAEYVLLLNVFYNRWQGNSAPCVALTDVGITGPTSGYTGTLYTFTAVLTPANASTPITYTWTPAPDSGQGSITTHYTWPTTGTKTITLLAENCGGSDTATHDITLAARPVASHFISLPLVLRATATPPPSGDLIQPADLVYVGAFRLPDDGERPRTFEYGGNAMTFNPDNGTLFVMGHDRMPWGDLPDGNQVAEIDIPMPVNSRTLEDLPTAEFRQGFHNVLAGQFHDLDEIPRVGMAYLDHPATGPKIHLGWGQHMPPEVFPPTHGWFNPTLTAPDFQGAWHIGTQNFNSVNGYLFEIPAAWADAHAQGRVLATGRYRDGGWGGIGPALFAYRPWQADGSPPPVGTQLDETPLLLYANSYETEHIERALDGYQHPDEWEGGAWLTTASGKSAVLFAGTKATGAKYWYGFVHPDGPEFPCVDTHADFTSCRLAGGTPCPPEDFAGCCNEDAGTCVSGRGWWSSRFDAQFILYDPAQLAQVAAEQLESWQPQPYASLDIDEVLYLNPPEWEREALGPGDQRRNRIGDAAFDRANGRLYVLELFGDGGKPVVHVWQVQ